VQTSMDCAPLLFFPCCFSTPDFAHSDLFHRVDIFFVISGFLIGGTFMTKNWQGDSPSLHFTVAAPSGFFRHFTW